MWDSGHTRKAHKSRPSASESCRKGDVPELTLSAINRRDPYSDGTIRNSRIAPSYRKILAQSHSAPGGHKSSAGCTVARGQPRASALPLGPPRSLRLRGAQVVLCLRFNIQSRVDAHSVDAGFFVPFD